MDSNYGRIHRVAFKAGVSTLFVIAMLATIGRLTIRFRYQRRLFADDFVLLFGCINLIAAFVITNVMFNLLYWDMSLILGTLNHVIEEFTAPGFGDRVLSFQQLCFSVEVLCWVTIFAVKMSYLLFFRQMVDRLKIISTYWKVTVGIVVVSGVFCICSIFISCPKFGVSAIGCAQQKGFRRTIIVSQFANAVNMITDLLIIAVPIILLRKVKIRMTQKVILGTFLCLSFCMIAICLVRTTSETVTGVGGPTVDVQWNVFWQIIEASVAVTVVSLTAFRSLYSFKTQGDPRNNRKNKKYTPPLYSYRKNLLSRKKQRKVDEFGDSFSDEQNQSLPSIPGATLTGIRSMIWGNNRSVVRAQKSTMHSEMVSVDEA